LAGLGQFGHLGDEVHVDGTNNHDAWWGALHRRGVMGLSAGMVRLGAGEASLEWGCGAAYSGCCVDLE
jgi:hypothetical protein